MKLKDAIKNKDYSLFKLSSNSFYNYYDTLSEVLYGYDYRISVEHYEAVERSDRVKVYAVREWCCTDTHVGLYLYLIDDEPVCLMYQTGRKNYPEWHFLSDYGAIKTKNLFEEYKPKYCLDYVDENEDLLELRLDHSLFNYDITPFQLGLSSLNQYQWALDRMETLEDKDKLAVVVNYLKIALDKYEKELSVISSNGSQEDIGRFVKSAEEILPKIVEILNKHK